MTPEQLAVCQSHGVDGLEARSSEKVGISRGALLGQLPLHGLRHPPEGDTTGWYIWAGDEWSDADGLFLPLHVEHLPESCPLVVKLLALPPGWRFLLAEQHEDVWYDPGILRV
jgi:hypothetical protein